jgi:F0F1-type ATP synthase assembly protein I
MRVAMTDDQRNEVPESGERQPWWAQESPDTTPLPPGYPDRPDARKLASLQEDLHRDRMARLASQNNTRVEKYAARVGKSAKDIGTYTLIPAMMIAGPTVGYGLGWLVEWKWGGAPWPGVIGLLFGLVAAFRQIFLILARKTKTDNENQYRR